MTMKNFKTGKLYDYMPNQSKLIDSDIIDILKTAKKLGIDTIDTAIAYGNSLNRLESLESVISKSYEISKDYRG